MSDRLSCVVMGGESTLPIVCGNALLSRGHSIVAVITADRNVAEWARRQSLTVAEPSQAMTALAGTSGFDCFFSINNGHIVPEELLAMARRAAVNYHDGLLPQRAGFNVPIWTVLDGEPRHGITWHLMETRLDAGDILHQTEFDVAPDETSFSLNLKCYEAAIASFGDLVDALASGTERRTSQDLSKRTYISRWKRPAAACAIDWTLPAAELVRFGRGLQFDGYLNPFGIAKVFTGSGVLLVSSIRASAHDAAGEPGRVLEINDDGIIVATTGGAVLVGAFRTGDGAPIDVSAACREYGISVGLTLRGPEPELAAAISERHQAIARHEEYWVKKLTRANPLTLASSRTAADAPFTILPLGNASTASDIARAPKTILTGFAVFLAKVFGTGEFEIAIADASLASSSSAEQAIFSSVRPFTCELDLSDSFAVAQTAIAEEFGGVTKRQTYCRDIYARYPELTEKIGGATPADFEVCVRYGGAAPTTASRGKAILTLAIDTEGNAAWIVPNTPYFTSLFEQFATFLNTVARDAETPLASISLLSAEEKRRMLIEWNDTAVAYDTSACVHQLIEQQADRTPDAIAVICGSESLTYRQLDERANQLAHYLAAKGAKAGTILGVCLPRSIHMPVALLAIFKAGAAYLPLDPDYPVDRLALMLEDSGALFTLISQDVRSGLTAGAPSLCLDGEAAAIAEYPRARYAAAVDSQSLAYVIYTSGSTGKPKGVMIRHRNVVNFFAGMSRELGSDPGVWLAVTSISFDISVLELFWTLAHGFKVVILPADAKLSVAPRVQSNRKLDFSLFYFATNAGDSNGDPYRLLLEGARFGDENGFAAVWTPERHFHAFGGLYPNPSVASAAVAAITKRIGIRAGSVVLPLHNPIRVAEEWALVDNLSHGRVGISFASGWHARDFTLAPENYAKNREILYSHIDIVRKLWRGDSVEFPDGKGVPTKISTLPRPVQKELPVWITAAGNPETYRMAGSIGANVLTHLLGQTLEEVAAKIEIYRSALRENGFDPEAGKVTLMLHTFAGLDREKVRETVRGPLREYLRTSLDLIKNAPWAFPAFKKTGAESAAPIQLSDLSPEDIEALLDRAFDRYFESSGLFGTPDDCAHMAEKARDIGVDEIGCLIDFGIDSNEVLAGLHHLNTARQLFEQRANAEDDSIPALIRRHAVTHLQCTPSMAKMLTLGPESRESLGALRMLLVGGEALPAALGRELASLVPTVFNMYGPTETTVWSTMHRVDPQAETMLIGRPIANTQVYILDEHRALVPAGVPGELYIGGDGVAPGYLGRPELTSERFVANPFNGNTKIYRTGDIARYRSDGTIEFVGRADYQIKIRGHRIEIGEIESVLASHPHIEQAAVVARSTDGGDVTLVAFYVAKSGASPQEAELRSHLESRLPGPMIPGAFVGLESFPLTPNGKLDRKALPSEIVSRPAIRREPAVYSTPAEETIAAIWKDTLRLDYLGPDDNFAQLGAHSLMMVQVHARLRQALTPDLTLIDMFRFPTVRQLAAYVSARLTQTKNGKTEAASKQNPNGSPAAPDSVAARIEMRRRLAAGRR